MAYQRKTRDVWHFYVDYGYGWEHELDEYSLAEIKQRRKEYRENCPQYPVKVVKARERIENTAFEKECECVDYELAVYRKQLDNSKNVIECNEALGYRPFDGGEYYECHDYRWFKPLNESGIELLNKAFPSSYNELGDDDIGKWFCVEYNDYNSECWWCELSVDQEEYANKLLGLLEPEQYDRSHYITELCPNCKTEVEMRWNVDIFGHKAYCPYCGKRLMLCDECRHPNDEFSNDCAVMEAEIETKENS